MLTLARASLLSLAAFVLGVAAGPAAALQGQIDPYKEGGGGGVACFRVYVDPENGSDANPGTVDLPKLTILSAMGVYSGPVVIVLLPGVYSAATNGESLPIALPGEVSIQGTNAMSTILDGEGAGVFLMNDTPGGHAGAAIDGVTFRGGGPFLGGASIFITGTETPNQITISNCFFLGNPVGILIQTIFNPLIDKVGAFIEHRPNVVNCTFANNGVGIWDTSLGDPFGIIRGEANPNVLNCLFHPNTTDIMGLDNLDVTSCAFNVWAGPIDLSNGQPQTIVNLSGVGPSQLYVLPSFSDYRLLPGGPVQDQGSPDSFVLNCGMKVFDFDGEGFCNKRVEGPNVDLGADEVGSQILAGYIPDTTTFGTQGGVEYRTAFLYVTPSAGGAGGLQATVLTGTESPGFLAMVPNPTPGARPRGTVAPIVGGAGELCLDALTLLPPYTLPLPPVGTPLVMNFTLPPSPVLYNQQLSPIVGATTDPLSNLQSYTLAP
ncbi:MAG: DUF1565 domain-containing protein [Planctomycetota bacterium]